MDYVVVVVEVGSIQKYIFNSNRLRENLGASYLVAQATGEWAFQAVHDACPDANNLNNPDRSLSTDNALNAEVIYSGGGNFVVIFRHEGGPDTPNTYVREFGAALSKKVIQSAPGLQLLIGVSQPKPWDNDALQQTVGETRQNLKRDAAWRPVSRPLLGLGVTVACRSTGLAAVGFDNDGPYSAETGAKIRAADDATRFLRDQIPLSNPKLEYTDDLDKLGRSEGDTSYIAVIHADGNGIGKWLGDQIGEGNSDRDYITKQRAASDKLKELSTKALQQTVPSIEALFDRQPSRDGEPRIEFARKTTKDGKPLDTWFMPLRPIVFGGDDLTIVCDGRIGVSFTTRYLKEFEKAAQAEGARLTASAGVAIVKVHYPFSRAYDLADELAGSAKKFLRNNALSFSTLDWHVATSGLSGDLDAIRKREYASGSLTARPYVIEDQDSVSRVQSWGNVDKSLKAFVGPEWSLMRSKAKALRDAIREGEEMVQRFLTLFSDDKKLPVVHGTSVEKHRVYFDALELADRYVSIEPDEANHG